MFEPSELPEPDNSSQEPTLSETVQANFARRALCEELEIQILTSAAQINAATYHFITLLGEFDENGGWHGDGIRSFSHWLLFR